MKLRPHEFDLSSVALPIQSFTWNKATNCLVAEASDFGALRHTFDPRTGRTWMHQLYNDACDIGIAIRSTTDRVVRFVLELEEFREGDLVAWHFKPLDRDVTTTVTIFND